MAMPEVPVCPLADEALEFIADADRHDGNDRSVIYHPEQLGSWWLAADQDAVIDLGEHR
jgi:hypothetical protein